MSYEALIEDLIDSQAELLGDGAVEVARGIRGLHLDPDGTVDDVSADPKAVVDDLAAAYVDDLGPAARAAMTSVAANYESQLDLPRSLE